MTIEDKITVKIPERYRILDKEIIYLVDFEIDLVKITRKNGRNISKISRTVKLKDQLFSNNESESNKEYFMSQLRIKCEAETKEKLEIKKVILTKELSFRSYDK